MLTKQCRLTYPTLNIVKYKYGYEYKNTNTNANENANANATKTNTHTISQKEDLNRSVMVKRNPPVESAFKVLPKTRG